MKVCFITPYPLRMISGVSRVVTDLCKGLKERGIDHLVITARHSDDIEKDEAVSAIEIDVSRLANFRDVYFTLKTAGKLLKIRNEIDILHLQSPHLPSLISVIFGRLFGKPVITTIHGKFPRPEKFLKRMYLRISIKGTFTFSDRITFVSEEDKRYYNIPSATVIENGIDTQGYLRDLILRRETRANLGITKDEVVLIYLGRLEANKGIYDLLEAFSEVKIITKCKLKLILVGSGEKYNILDRIKSLGLEEEVLVFDATMNVIPYYCASDIFVLYSKFEGLSMALLEASSFGLTVISTKIGGTPSLIKDGENGLLLDYGDKKGLVQKIKIVAEDKTLRKNMGIKARMRIIDNYSIEMTVDKYIDLYSNSLKGKGF